MRTRLGFAWVLLLEDFFTGADYCKISEIATARDGTGAGAALMNACEVWARDRGCTIIMLNVLRENAHARAFYEGLWLRARVHGDGQGRFPGRRLTRSG